VAVKVFLEMTGHRKSFAADLARVRTFSGVNTHVFLEVPGVSERTATDFTHKPKQSDDTAHQRRRHHVFFNQWRSSFSGHCFLAVEHSATERHVSTITDCCYETPEDLPL